jgi:peroxiredoxin
MLEPGAPAPNIELSDLEGARWSLREAIRNGPVLLAFFKSSCPTCQLTFPFLQRLIDHPGPASPQLVAVSQDDAPTTRRFHERFGLSMRTLIDDSRTYTASNAYGITNVPSLFLVEPDGTISWALSGFNKVELERVGQRFGTTPFLAGEQVPDMRPG